MVYTIYHFENNKGFLHSFNIVDIKNENGEIVNGNDKNINATFPMLDNDFM